MNARLSFGFILVSLLLNAVTFARTPITRSDSPLESVVQASWLNDSGRITQVSQSTTEDSADGQLPAPLSAAPPPDPEVPAWGQYQNPNTNWIGSPPREYDLIGPPRGFIRQNPDAQAYRSVVTDPDSVLAVEETFGQSIDINRPDGIGPIGLFGDHTLPAGKAFFSYRYLQNSYDHNYVGSTRIGVPTGYPLAPTRMLQDSQVALLEYGATQDLTVMAYLPFQHNELISQTSTGSDKTSFTNPGDIRIMGLLVVGRGDRSQSHVNFGLSTPVGFLEQLNFQPGGTPSVTPVVPYQLRTSSGTYDLLLGYTYRKQTEYWTWGAQANGVIPTGMNATGYELGDQLQLTTWLSRRLTERWSTSARLDGRLMENIHGSDSRLDPTQTPANQPNAQGYRYLNGLLGVNYLFTRPGHRISEQRLFLESGVPLYQWVDGQQLGLAWTLNAGWGMVY